LGTDSKSDRSRGRGDANSLPEGYAQKKDEFIRSRATEGSGKVRPGMVKAKTVTWGGGQEEILAKIDIQNNEREDGRKIILSNSRMAVG